jgi:hypothetical protein
MVGKVQSSPRPGKMATVIALAVVINSSQCIDYKINNSIKMMTKNSLKNDLKQNNTIESFAKSLPINT